MKRKTSALLTQELSRKLVDTDLMHKYGTSLNVNMSRDYQRNLETKYQQLKSEFQKINKDSDDYISFDELKSFLHSYSEEVNNKLNKIKYFIKTGAKFTDDYIHKLYDVLDIDKNNQISM